MGKLSPRPHIKSVRLIIQPKFMQTVPLLFLGNFQVSVPSVVVRLEIFPDHVQALSLEKLVWIQQSKDIVYMIGQVSEPCVEFVVELAVIEHSNSFLAGHLRMLLPSTNINDAQGQNEIYITLNLNPHFFP